MATAAGCEDESSQGAWSPGLTPQLNVVASADPSASLATAPIAQKDVELPIEILSYILSMLGVADKIRAVEAFPSWNDALHCSASWNAVSLKFTDLDLHCEDFHAKMKCITAYGDCFTSLAVQFDRCPMDKQLQIIREIGLSCASLREVDVIHPPELGFKTGKILQTYVAFLSDIVDKNEGLTRIGLSYEAYNPINSNLGIYEVFLKLSSPEHKIVKLIDRIVISHLMPLVKPVHMLMTCCNLRELGCEIQCLDTDVLSYLMKRTCLCDLYLLNDETTVHLQWNERFRINWTALQVSHPSHKLRVHYMVAKRSFRFDCLVPNPFLHTLAFDCFFEEFFAETIRECIRLYGMTLHVLLLLSSYDEPPFRQDDSVLDRMHSLFGALVLNVKLLHTLVLTIPVPPIAILTVAANKRVEQLHVLNTAVRYEHKHSPSHCRDETHEYRLGDDEIYVNWWQECVSDPARLVNMVAKFSKGRRWQLLNQQQISSVVRKLTSVF